MTEAATNARYAYSKAKRMRRLSAGRCANCGKRPHKRGCTWCIHCLREKSLSQNDLRDWRRSRGLCVWCGRQLHAKGFVGCGACRKRNRKSAQRHRDKYPVSKKLKIFCGPDASLAVLSARLCGGPANGIEGTLRWPAYPSRLVVAEVPGLSGDPFRFRLPLSSNVPPGPVTMAYEHSLYRYKGRGVYSYQGPCNSYGKLP